MGLTSGGVFSGVNSTAKVLNKRKEGFSFADYPNLSKEWGLEILKSEIETRDLFKEIENLKRFSNNTHPTGRSLLIGKSAPPEGHASSDDRWPSGWRWTH